MITFYLVNVAKNAIFKLPNKSPILDNQIIILDNQNISRKLFKVVLMSAESLVIFPKIQINFNICVRVPV